SFTFPTTSIDWFCWHYPFHDQSSFFIVAHLLDALVDIVAHLLDSLIEIVAHLHDILTPIAEHMDRDETAAPRRLRASLYELIDLLLRHVEPVPTSWTFDAHQTLPIVFLCSASLRKSAAASEASHSCYSLPYCTAQSPSTYGGALKRKG